MDRQELKEAIGSKTNRELGEWASGLGAEVQQHQITMDTQKNLFFRDRAASRLKETIDDLTMILIELHRRA